MRVLIACGNQLWSYALKGLLDNSDCGWQVDALAISKTLLPDITENYDVIMTDYLTLYKIPKKMFGDSKVLIMDNGLERETIVSLLLTETIAGFIPVDSDIGALVKAIKVVHQGEIWIDNGTVKSLLDRAMTKKIKDIAKLTERETAIIRLVREGYRNRGIAHVLSISEQTVKSHLNRIFQKMHVSARTELIAKLENNHQTRTHNNGEEL